MVSVCTDHEHWATSVEPRAIGVLPDVLDLLGVPSDETLREVLERALDGFGMALESALTPSDDARLCFDAHKEPSRRNAENLEWASMSILVRKEVLDRITSIFVILFGDDMVGAATTR